MLFTLRQSGITLNSAGESTEAAKFIDLFGANQITPVAEGIGIGPETRFTGKTNKITLEVSR